MKKLKVFSQSFPTQKYQLIETISQKNKHTVAKYKNLEDQSKYLFHEYSFRSLPDKIKRRIVRQIQGYSQYALKDINVADEIYIFESKERVKISLRTKMEKNKSLSDLIQTNKYIVNPQTIAQQMINLSLLTHCMHQNNHAHGALQLSNIYCSNEGLMIGKPKYSQIEKWVNAHIIIDDDTIQQSFSEAEDVWSIGFCFLQMVLNKVIVGNVNKQTVCKEYLPRVANPNFRHALSVMLKRGGESVGILGVMGMLSNITNKDQFAFGPIPKHEECTLLRFTAFNHQTYRPMTLNIVKSIKRQGKGFEMNFILENNSVMCIVTGKAIYITIELTEELKNYCKAFKWLRLYLLEVLLKDHSTKFYLTHKGFLQISINNKVAKHLKLNFFKKLSVDSFNNVCNISGEKQRRGLILTQNIVITPACNIQELKRSEDKLYFKSEKLNSCAPLEYECYFVQDQLQLNQRPTGPHLQYCFIDFVQTISLAYFGNYLKLIKNYDEDVIEEKIGELEDANVFFNYQLGSRLLTGQDIVFNKDTFTVTNSCSILSGEPLRLNISYNSEVSCAVIGLYFQNNTGILFNDQFYRSIFTIMEEARSLSEIRSAYLPFTVIDCKAYRLEEGQLPCINSKSLRQYKLKKILDRNLVFNIISTLQKNEKQNLKQLGFYNYLAFKIQNLNDGQIDYLHLKKADHYFSQYYPQGNIVNAVVKAHLILQIFTNKRNNIFFPQYQQSKLVMDHYKACINILSNYHHNIMVHQQVQYFYLQDSGQLQAYEGLQQISNEFGIYKYSVNLYTALINYYKSIPNQKINVHQNETKLKDLNQKRFNFILPFNRLQRKIRRVKKHAENNRFGIVNDLMEELFARKQFQVTMENQKQKKIIQLWKSTLVSFVTSCNDLLQVLQFQRITKKYYEEGYVHTRDVFRKKQMQVEKNEPKLIYQ